MSSEPESVQTATCVSDAIYSAALTRGKRYEILQFDEAKGQIRIRGDNGRTRWFPLYSFDLTNQEPPYITHFEITNDPGALDPDVPAEERPRYVNVEIMLSNGERRDCDFITPENLALAGYAVMVSGRRVQFFYDQQFVIVISDTSEESIGAVLTHLEHRNELATYTDLRPNRESMDEGDTADDEYPV
jgi:hypothetical protein